jgi:leucine dehydrogenase
MGGTMQRMIEEWDGLAVVTRHDRATASWIFVALHDDRLGTPTGGTRMKVYERPEDGLRDAMRLAEGMTQKWAAIDLTFGGGKGVLALSRPLDGGEREGILARYGSLLNSLRGAFETGEDLGTTPEDMLRLSRETRFVHGLDTERDEVRDPGPYTALGVHAGIRAALQGRFGDPNLKGRRVLIQGVGDVGAPLAELCAADEATLLLSDLDSEGVEQLAGRLEAETVAPDAVYSTACDVYSPCAVGATLNATTIPTLQCAIAAGSANNQLEERADADRLHEREILYAPDFVINAGGALAFGLRAQGEHDDGTLRRRVAGLGGSLHAIFDEAGEHDESPLHAALRRVDRVLNAAASRPQ